MTAGDEPFLSRWSRRKRAVAEDDAPAAAPGPADDPAPTPGAAEPVPAEEAEEAEVPLEDLPALDEIDADTDLTPWLKRKVPPEWRNAALRRMWVSTPGIREFRGLADYDWDFNAVGGVPGFGPMRATDDIRALLAQALGEPPAEVQAEVAQSEVEDVRAAAAEAGGADSPPTTAEDAPPEGASGPGGQAQSVSTGEHKSGPEAQEDEALPHPHPAPRRRGGGATPA